MVLQLIARAQRCLFNITQDVLLRALATTSLAIGISCLTGCMGPNTVTQATKTLQSARASTTLGPNYTLKIEKVLRDGGSWLVLGIDKGCLQRSTIEYGPSDSKGLFAEIESEIGGSVPSGYEPFAELIVILTIDGTVTFQGSGRNIELRSKWLADFQGVDFTAFVYNGNGDILEQYDAGEAESNTLIFPSPFQNGFQVVNQEGGTGGNAIALGYQEGVSHQARATHSRC